MDPKELAEFLAGKTIKKAITSTYLDWTVIHTFIFDDGSELELGGNADVAYVDWVKMAGEDRIIPMAVGGG